MEHTQNNIERRKRRAQQHRRRRKQMKSIRRVLTVIIIILVLVLLLVLFFKNGNNSDSSADNLTIIYTESKESSNTVSIVENNANSNRDAFIDVYLGKTYDATAADEDIFSITVTPISRKKCTVHITNKTDAFFTGTITIHESAMITLNAFGPAVTKSFEISLGLKEEDVDYVCDGLFLSYVTKPDLSFVALEAPMGERQVAVSLDVDQLTDSQKEELLYYYYIIGTLYNHAAPTEYILYNADGTKNFGSLVVDAIQETVDLYENGALTLTADF